jgi:hypothetical protein
MSDPIFTITKNSWIWGERLPFRAWQQRVREDNGRTIGRFYHRQLCAHHHFPAVDHAALKRGGLFRLSLGIVTLPLPEGRINPLLSGKKITEEVIDNGSRFCMSDAVREIKK